jgi:NAD(P)-dependent dehydrogenase (short-subunit alcohol dehydrogenase family)
MGDRLKGRAALVTGAGNGIGKAIAQLFAAEGASVVVNDLGTDPFGEGKSSAAADEAVAEIVAAGGAAVAHYDSVAEPGGCARAVQTAVDSFGACDIVVGNAGALHGATLDSSDETWRKMVDLVLSQKFWLAREAVPAMVEKGWGRVVFTTSEIARGTQGMPLGAAVFAATVGMAHDLAHAYRDSGVTFNCFAPGAATRTHAMARSFYEEGYKSGAVSEEQWKHYLSLPPTEYVAPIVAWLCTDAAAGVTGEVFNTSGGSLSRWSRYEDRASLFKGGANEAGPWTLDELDALVPKCLLP